MDPLVSVVVPIYNVERYLKECVKSLVGQSHKNIEIILVNDGSKDGSGKIADQLARTDNRITVIHKKNGGLSDARNSGMNVAKGEYITFVDSDDYVDKKFIELMLATAITTKAEIVQCNNTRDSSTLGSSKGKSTQISGSSAFVELLKYKLISPTAWAKLYRTSLFNDSNFFFPVGRIHEDTALLYKLVWHANTIATIGGVLYYYRKNEASIMNAAYTEHHYNSVLKYNDELDMFIKENKIDISMHLIYKHKALRYLSVLNKMAQSEATQPADYDRFKREYIYFSARSYSALCIAGIIPAKFPFVFRSMKNVIPLLRQLLGKS